jgi:hypothetical protein
MKRLLVLFLSVGFALCVMMSCQGNKKCPAYSKTSKTEILKKI